MQFTLNNLPLSLINILTGICSVIGNSVAIVPARSHEFVMVTSALKSSPHKNPQLVPSYYKTVKWKKLVRAEYEEQAFPTGGSGFLSFQ